MLASIELMYGLPTKGIISLYLQSERLMHSRIITLRWICFTALLSVHLSGIAGFPVQAQSLQTGQTPVTADEFYERGAARKERGEYQGAYEDLSNAIRLDPKHYKAYSKRCAVLGNSGQAARAMADCQRSLAINPQFFRAFYNRGIIRDKLGDAQGAMQDYNQAIKINPRYGLAHLTRGITREEMGDLRGALLDYTAAIEGSESDFCDICAHTSRAKLRLRTQDFTGAESDYSYLLERVPEDLSYLIGRGTSRFAIGKKEGGHKDLSKAAALSEQRGLEEQHTQILNLLKHLELDANRHINT
jgi:tetratricopeptide (TPR) repeat protein